MVPILNHSVFINIKSVITSVIIEIVSDIELDITISLLPGLNVERLYNLFPSAEQVESAIFPLESLFKLGFKLYSGK